MVYFAFYIGYMFGLKKIAAKIEIPPQGVDADLAIPSFRKNPQALALKIKQMNNPLFQNVAVSGRYVNIKFNYEHLAGTVLEAVNMQRDAYGYNMSGAGKKIIIEYSAPNIAKPMHMGHARNNALGHALVNIYRANGYTVITTNHFGDWGMSLAKIMLAYQKWGDRTAFERDPIPHLLSLYVRITKEIEIMPELEEETRALFKKLEDGDKELRALWQKFREVSVAHFKCVYALMGITFDIWHGESFYEPFINEIIQEALDKKVATQEVGGPVVVNAEQFKLPSYLLRKSDGASLYSARDLAVGRWRLEEYNPDKIVYVVGHDQELYLQQIFKTLGLMGYPEKKFQHISYGVVTLHGKKIATRSGDIVFLEDALQEAIKRAKGISEVGIGAVVFNMLSAGREHDIAFNWDSALNLQGNSAPYIQYGFVRAKAIVSKAQRVKGKMKSVSGDSRFALRNSSEFSLVKLIAWYPEVVRQAHELNAPHLIATFLNNFVQEFNRFYAITPVVTENGADEGKVALVGAVAQVIKNGLWLLGIAVPEKM